MSGIHVHGTDGLKCPPKHQTSNVKYLAQGHKEPTDLGDFEPGTLRFPVRRLNRSATLPSIFVTPSSHMIENWWKSYKKKKKKKSAGDFKCTMPPAPCFVIPRGLSTLYRYSLTTTVAQDKPHHEKPLTWDCYNHKGSCTVFRPYLTTAAGISPSSFVRVSKRH